MVANSLYRIANNFSFICKKFYRTETLICPNGPFNTTHEIRSKTKDTTFFENSSFSNKFGLKSRWKRLTSTNNVLYTTDAWKYDWWTLYCCLGKVLRKEFLRFFDKSFIKYSTSLINHIYILHLNFWFIGNSKAVLIWDLTFAHFISNYLILIWLVSWIIWLSSHFCGNPKTHFFTKNS